MYRVALIQNESEMMRYGWSDIKAAFNKDNYILDSYTSENISSLFAKINDDCYDALIVAMNACKNQKINSALSSQKNESIKYFLSQHKGLYIGYQARVPQIDFLPDEYDISFLDRKENSNEGRLKFYHNNISILSFPNNINKTDVTKQCIENNFVEGIYWTHIVSNTREKFDVVIADNLYAEERPLVFSSRGDIPARIIISTIPIEWQGHDKLFENILHYIIEGRPLITIITKKENSSKTFKYLISNAEIRKLAVKVYKFENINDLSQIKKGIHDILVFDPTWTENEILDFNKKYNYINTLEFSRVFYFRNSETGDVILSTLSAFKDFKRISQNALTFLLSSYSAPFWAGSFWTTVDVICTLSIFNRPVSQYADKIQEEVDKKHNINNSYDEVVGATCGLLILYEIFYGKTDKRYQNTLDWLENNFSNKALFEKATAINTLTTLGEIVDTKDVISLKNEILSSTKSFIKNEAALIAYIRVLVSFNYLNEAIELALNLKALQNTTDGGWINVSNTSLIVLSLLELQKKSNNKNPIIEEMIYKGIIYIKNNYSEKNCNWNNDPLATSLAIHSLKIFEEEIEFPIDELLISFLSENNYSRNFIAIENASQMNIKLQEQNNSLITKIKEEVKTSKFSVLLSVWSSGISLLAIFLFVSIIKYAYDINRIYKLQYHILPFLKNTFLSYSSLILLVPLSLFVWLLEKYKMLPVWIENFINMIGKVKKWF